MGTEQVVHEEQQAQGQQQLEVAGLGACRSSPGHARLQVVAVAGVGSAKLIDGLEGMVTGLGHLQQQQPAVGMPARH